MTKKLYIALLCLIAGMISCTMQNELPLPPANETLQPHEVRNMHNYYRSALNDVNNNNKALLFGFAASVFSSLLLFYIMSLRYRKGKLLEAYATETRISKKLHDEIANEIYGALLYVTSEETIAGTKKERLAAQLDNIYSGIRNISRENADLDFGPDFALQLKMMVNCYITNNSNVLIKGLQNIEWELLSPSKKIVVYRTVQELMVNMHKHSRATVVVLDFSSNNKKITIAYRDNGVGVPTDKNYARNGLTNICQRLKGIGGVLEIDNKTEKGFKATMVFPQ